jgi:hypothetical protein
MEIPRRFAEIMTDTSSNDVRWLAYEEASALEVPPSIAEWVAASCGAMSKSEQDTLSKIGAEIAWTKNVSQRDRALHDQLQRKYSELRRCTIVRIFRARDAIRDL